jgi:hypothetical protein
LTLRARKRMILPMVVSSPTARETVAAHDGKLRTDDRGPWLFSRWLDLAMLGIPLLVVVGAFVVARGDMSGGLTRTYAGWGSQFILGNTTHVVLTFLLLFARRDMLRATPGQAPTVLIGGSIVWVTSFVAYYFINRYAPTMTDMLEALVITLASHHTFSQSKGLWSLYAMQADGAPTDLERRMQRHYVPVALILVMVRWLFVAKAPGRMFPFIGAVPGLEAILPFSVTFGLVLAWIVFATITVRAVAASARERGFSQPKTRYVIMSSFGVLLMILVPGWGSVLVSGVHGMEYFLLTQRMLKPMTNEKTRLGVHLVIPAMAISVAPLLVVGLLTGPFVAHPTQTATLAMFAMNGLVLAHYFADAFIYRFRIPSVRRIALARLGYAPPSPAPPAG